MKMDIELEQDVRDELNWCPVLSGTEIGVTAKDGVVTLTGIVDSYTRKLAAQEAAKRVKGVKAVAEAIEVKFDTLPAGRTDTQIAASIVGAFKANGSVPGNEIVVEVQNGWVTLSGQVSWNYQRQSAVEEANKQTGVKGVTSNIAVKSDVADAIEKESVESALRRDAAIAASDIFVTVSGGVVTLTGTVHSWYESDAASRVAWSAPGVTVVDNQLAVEYNAYDYDD